MVRIIGVLAGLFFTVAVLWALVTGVGPAFSTLASEGQFVEATAEHEFHKDPKELHLASDGLLGHWDKQQLQRGMQVYSEVCAACHSLKQVAFRDLEQLGYDEGQVKAFAATKQVPGIDPVTGEATTRPGLPTDYFPSPFANDVAARAANNNAVPPDLSLITKARHDGPAYVYSLLTGYREPPAELLEEFPDAAPGPGLYYNPYFANLNLAMAPPLSEGIVTYADGTEATVDQMAQDVAAFLTWTAEPTLVKRKQTGWPAVLFVLFATILAYFAKRSVWAPVKPKRED